jgi:hypothetical protein
MPSVSRRSSIPRAELAPARLGVGAGFLTLTDEAGLIVAIAVLLKA